jgi:hypothetical protein
MEVVQSIGAPLDAGFRNLRLQEVEKRRFVQCGHGYMKWKRAGIGKACMPLFRADVKAVDVDGDYVEK